jgi:hypothetical protein
MCVLRGYQILVMSRMKYERRPLILIEIRVKDLDMKIKDLSSIKYHKETNDT